MRSFIARKLKKRTLLNAEADMRGKEATDLCDTELPVEDTTRGMRKAAKEQGLKVSLIVLTSCSSGKRKVLWCFNQWAQTTLGNKFDRQFAMQGRVQSRKNGSRHYVSKKVGRWML
jgi:hypothetical protein